MPRIVLYEAFGESKTPKEWWEDRRCVVSYDTLVARLVRGWPTEAAIVIPDSEKSKGHIAFGQSKTLIQWLTDSRCRVPATILLKRLAAGWDFETALTKPEDGYEPEPVPEKRKARVKVPSRRKHEAFGEWKTLSEWGRDPRSPLNAHALQVRMSHGQSLEAAILFSEEDCARYHWAFGEHRKLGTWLRDKRMAVSASVLKGRLEEGENFEEALTRPADEPRPASTVKKEVSPEGQLKEAFGINELTIDGETKTIAAWARDPKCEITWVTLRYRVRKGWPIDINILKESRRDSVFKRLFRAYDANGNDLGQFRTVKAASEHILRVGSSGKVVQVYTGDEWPIPRPAKPPKSTGKKRRLITAWGETKTGREWARDSRYKVGNLLTLYRRLDQKGGRWTTEDAISTPAKAIYMSELKKMQAKRYRAFGKFKTLDEWAQEPMCTVTATGLKSRLEKGMTLEEALTAPVQRSNRK